MATFPSLLGRAHSIAQVQEMLMTGAQRDKRNRLFLKVPDPHRRVASVPALDYEYRGRVGRNWPTKCHCGSPRFVIRMLTHGALQNRVPKKLHVFKPGRWPIPPCYR